MHAVSTLTCYRIKVIKILKDKKMVVECKKCVKTFELTKAQEDNVKEFAQKNMPFMVETCPLCHSMVILHPLSLMGITDELPEIEDNRLFYCPEPCCIGYIEYDKKNKKYNCSECGATWKNKNEIYNSISEIIKKYHHRKDVYKKMKNGYKSITIGTAQEKYYSNVQNDETI
jgi:hypothetical protein